MKSIAVALVSLACVYHLITVGNLEKESTLLKHEMALHKAEADILRDQMTDMTFQWSSKKTYEEGVMDGIHNSKSHEYMAGYHFAVGQLFAVPEDSVTSTEAKP
jgi:hypothetical protein